MMNETVPLNRTERTLLESVGKSIRFIGTGSMIWGAMFIFFCLFVTFDIKLVLFFIGVFLLGFMARKLSSKILDVFKDETPSREALVRAGEGMNELFNMLKFLIILIFGNFVVMVFAAFV